jgi:hypothetical protein
LGKNQKLLVLTKWVENIMNFQLLSKVIEQAKLAVYFMAIAVWYSILFGNVTAYGRSIESADNGFDFEDNSSSQLFLAAGDRDVDISQLLLPPAQEDISFSQLFLPPASADIITSQLLLAPAPADISTSQLLLAPAQGNLTTTQLLLAAVQPEPDENKEESSESNADKISQITAPLPTPTVPNLPPAIAPALTEIRPLNSVLGAELIPAPNNNPAVAPSNAPTLPQSKPIQDPRYLVPPEELEPQTVDPFSTQFILNGNKISHFSNTNTVAGYEWGNFRTSDLNFDVYSPIKSNTVQSVTKDRVLRVNSTIEVAGMRSVTQNQDIVVSVTQPQNLLGVRQQISLDGDCLDGSGRTCTFLPGITIDDSVISQRKLQPTGVKITSQFGDAISPASVTATRQAGFQAGANGESYGLDLYFPAVGVIAPTSTPSLTGSRREEITTGVAVNYSWMNQNLATNGEESTLGRTIRSINYINGDRNQVLNLAVSTLGQILPQLQPAIAPGKPGARITVNPNLFRAANAVRIPDNSLTVYQTGIGRGVSYGEDPKIPPGASHQAIWVGLSPIVEREFVRDFFYQTRREPTIIASGGGEGGNIPVAVNLNQFGFNSGALQNVYAQAYVTVYNRDVDRVDVDTVRQRTDYYPHISLSGTYLTENTLWRYFAGTIVNAGFQPKTTENIKAYLGTDYSVLNPQGLSFTVGGIGYLNPDPEYYSQIYANASQTIALGSDRRNNLVVGVNANYIADGAITIQSLPVRTTQSFINAGLTANLGDISIAGTQFVGNILPESIESKTLFNIGWKLNDRVNIGAFYTAFDRNISTNPYGASLSFIVDPQSNSKLSLGWNAAEIDFRRTLGTTANIFRDNTFSLSYQHEF